VVWDEAVNSDMSDNPTAPTAIPVAPGTNSIVARLDGTDLDFFTITVPAGSVFSGIFNPVYDSIDQISFAAIANETSLPATVLNDNPAGLLGYTHFGPGAIDDGENLFDVMSTVQNGVPGFTRPLPAGSYSFWVQQANTTDEGYQFDLVIDKVPEPCCGALVLIGGVACWWRRGKRA
ncbi:MAG TPA: hypothetical protein VH107_02740, partial [Lacipirellulaceae bacterium]|nr:hypothetical protein [Lacipirellulaceae bacterium]